MYQEVRTSVDELKESFPNSGDLFDKSKLTQPIKDIKEKDALIPAFLQVRGLQKQHIDSFDYMINYELKNIIMAKNNNIVLSDADPNFYLRYKDIRVGKPVNEDEYNRPLFPHECRIRDMTYSANIYVDLEYVLEKKLYPKKDVFIGKIPIMLGSNNCHLTGKSNKELADAYECPFDPRGYFIIKGTEKVILIQEQLSKNRIIVEKDNKTDSIVANIASYTLETKNKATVITKNGKIYLKSNSFTDLIPILIVFKAMNIESEQEIVQLIGSEDFILEALSICFQDVVSNNIYTQNQALEYLGSKLKTLSQVDPSRRTRTTSEEARDILSNVFLAHIPCRKFDFFPKCLCLALMVRRILEAIKDPKKIDDKDYYGNKRLECAGQLMALLFEDLFKKVNFELKKELDKRIPKLKEAERRAGYDVTKILHTETITNGFVSTLSTGNWNLKRFKMDRKGITQILNRMSYIAALGMMTRIQSQFEKSRKISGPRSLQPSHWGILCPSDTPDGENCGLVKNLALLTHITMDEPDKPIMRLSINLGTEDIGLLTGKEIHSKDCFIVFLNGQIIGVHKKPYEFVRQFRILRRKGKIGEFTSIFLDEVRRSINIASDYGRLTRPLIIVENGKPKVTTEHIEEVKSGIRHFNDFISDGLIEYLDVNEEDNCYIAIKEQEITSKTTHLEIDPLSILGVVAGLIPYPHHNQSPRNTYQCAMGKQALGAIASNQFTRVDTLLFMMVYPQTPLVRTKTIELINYHQFPAGHNASVAVMSYSGYDIEDAIVINKSSLDRGYGRVTYMRRYGVELERYPNMGKDTLLAPVKNDGNKKRKGAINKHQHALDNDGLPMIGEKLNNGDVYVNKYTPLGTNERSQNQVAYTPSLQIYKNDIPSTVDRVILTSNKHTFMSIKVMLRQVRRPELGDKMSSRHGQKGVCGLIVNQEDLPFSELGWNPDLIMNPHGFPSRMTVGKLIELLAGKAACYDGKFKYGTAFAGDKVEDVGKILIQNGFSFTGKDCLISGITGEYLNCYVFSGPIFYQRLKHMVADKMHARSKGPVNFLTRQPLEGRAKDGGLRLGEMERDCLIGYGASNLLLERLMISSDQYTIQVCVKCGLFQQDGYCNHCQTKEVFKIKLPYPCKLLFQELMAMGIRPKIGLKDI